MDALEDDFAVGALHVEHALVAQHAGAVDLHDRTEEVLQLGRVEGLVGAEDEALDVVVVVMVVRVVAVLTVLVIMVVIMVMVVVTMLLLGFEEIGVDFELGVEVEAREVEHLGQRHLAEVRRLDRRTGFMCLMR